MLGYIYLGLSVALGYVICSLVFPQLSSFTKTTLKGKKIEISSIFILMPAWFITGTLVMSWLSYILACSFKNLAIPLLYADEIVMIISIPVIIFGMFMLLRSGKRCLKGQFSNITIAEKIIFITLMILFYALMRITFRVSHGQLYIGLTVFSDFTPHISMIRSFSYGQNFPTQYSVCAGADVKYHFMFEFLVGNYEFLGMRIDHAFNIPSFLGIMSMYSLLYVMAVRITGKKITGLITCILLTFRSSSSLFSFLAGIPESESRINRLKNNIEFIGSTNHEDWGLWNLNVYCNQRHLAFGISVMLLILLIYLPHLYKAFERMEEYGNGFKSYLKVSLLNKQGWMFEDLKSAIGAGIFLGALGFYNGAVLICTVLILFFMAAASDRRTEHLITAAIAGTLSLIQTHTFIDGKTFNTSYFYGFLADNRTFFGSLDFILKLLGVLPIVLLITFLISKSVRKYLMFAFSTPIIMAFTVSLTPDIAVNHKYIMMSVMLLNIFASAFIVMLFSNKKYQLKFLAGCLLICMTATGIYDTYIVFRRNNPAYAMVNNLKDDLTVWIADNCSAEDLFLTSNYYITNLSTGSEIILGGAMMFNAWQYFGWSAGYDTSARDEVVNEIYSCEDKNKLISLVRANRIDYIVIDSFNRQAADYVLNESIFEETFDAVFERGTGDSKITIYNTHKSKDNQK